MKSLADHLNQISTKLIRGFHWLSTDPREMPPKTPLIILREICRELEQKQLMGVDIKEIAQKVSELEEYAPAETNKIPGTFTIPRAIKEGRRYSRVEGKWYFDPPKDEK